MTTRLRSAVSVGGLLFILIAILAVGLRVYDLGWRPLTGDEAVHALAASAAARQPSPFWMDGQDTVPSSPAHYALSSLLFTFFGSSNFGARVIPALFGMGVVLLAGYLVYKNQPYTAIIAIWLSLSTVLVTTSRTSDGAIISGFALFLVVLALISEIKWQSPGRRILVIAFGLGLGFASGPHFYTGLLSLLALLAVLFALRKRSSRFDDHPLFAFRLGEPTRGEWLTGIGVMAVTSFGFSTLFGVRPGGLAGIPEALGIWLQGWSSAGEFRPLTILFLLPIYESLLLFFAVIGAIWSIRNQDLPGIGYAIWSLAALAFVLAYPGRQPEDLFWVVLPMSVLAALGLLQLLRQLLANDNWLVFTGFTTALLVLLIFSYLQLAANAQNPAGPQSAIGPGIGYFGLALLALGLFGVVGIMIGLGWSWDMAKVSAGSAFGLFLLAHAISNIWGLNFRSRAASARELWRQDATTIGQSMLVRSLENISQAQTGLKDGLPIQLYDTATPAMAWGLRQFERFEQPLGGIEASPIVLALDREAEPQLRADYIGQSFKVAEGWGWTTVLPPDFLQWVIRRNPPTVSQQWLLLLRQDLSESEEIEDPDAIDSS